MSTSERHRVRDDRVRALDALAQRLLAMTQEETSRDAEASTHIQSAVESMRRFALRAGWIE